MAVATEKLKAGDVLYDTHSHKMGNTTMSCEGVWMCRVREVAEDGSWALVSWNGNPARKHYRRLPNSWKRNPKEWVRTGWRGRECYMCNASEDDGHEPDCDHPRAVSRRKREAKAAAKAAKESPAPRGEGQPS